MRQRPPGIPPEDQPNGFLAKQHPQQKRSKYNVQAGEKAGVGDLGIEESHLLKTRCETQNETGNDHPLPLICRDPGPARDERDQDDGRQHKADTIEEIRHLIARRHPLCNEARAPDNGNHEEQQIGFEAHDGGRNLVLLDICGKRLIICR